MVPVAGAVANPRSCSGPASARRPGEFVHFAQFVGSLPPSGAIHSVSMLLPNADQAQVDASKITDYLLSLTHPAGRTKARFLLRLGFDPVRWQELAESLKSHGEFNEVSACVESLFGTRYVVDGPLAAPLGLVPHFRTVWILEAGQVGPRLVTAYPLEQQS